jgi:sulfatase maturation enzyme AslB (radical SAM superfamily)
MTSSDFFCHLPFTAIEINGEFAKPCCNFSSDPIPLDGYESNSIILDVKKKLFRSVVPRQCNLCVEQEKHSGKSLRTLANEFHPDYTKEVLNHGDTYSSLQTVTITGSNTCNLKCLPCYNGSYVRSEELHKLGIIKTQAKVQRFRDMEKILRYDIKQLTLCAGEPFYDKDTWELIHTLVHSGKSKDIRLDINTNLTFINNENLDFLSGNFASVMIKGSIDGVGSANDYLRYPSKWQTIEQSVDLIQKHKNISFVVTTALSNLSFLQYHKLFKWCHSRQIINCFISHVLDPQILSYYNLPIVFKQNLFAIYQDLMDLPELSNRSIYTLNALQTLCKDDTDPGFDKSTLISYLDTHDRHRGTDWKTVFPELLDIG